MFFLMFIYYSSSPIVHQLKCLPFICSSVYLFICLSGYLSIYSLIHLFIRSKLFQFFRSFVHFFANSSVNLFIYVQFTCSIIHLFIRSKLLQFFCSFINFFAYSCVHLFICDMAHLLTWPSPAQPQLVLYCVVLSFLSRAVWLVILSALYNNILHPVGHLAPITLLGNHSGRCV